MLTLAIELAIALGLCVGFTYLFVFLPLSHAQKED